MSPPRLDGLAPTSIVVTKEELAFDCSRDEGEVVCSFEATYYLENPTDEAEWISGMFYGSNCEDIRMTSEAKSVATAVSPEDFEMIDKAVSEVIEGENQKHYRSYLPWKNKVDKLRDTGRYLEIQEDIEKADETTERELKKLPGFSMKLQAGERRTLVAEGKILTSRPHQWGARLINALEARHLLFNKQPNEFPFFFEYYLSPLKTWADVYEVDITIKYDDGLDITWSLSKDLDRLELFKKNTGEEAAQKAWTKTEEEGELNLHWLKSSSSSKGDIPNFLLFGFDETKPRIYNGGPILRIGAVYHRSPRTFRMGLGYEIARPNWLLLSALAETDFKDQVTLIPLLKIASPWVMLPYLQIAPSFSLGVGAPVQLTFDGEQHVGVRIQADAHLGPVGLVMPFDFFPGNGLDEDEKRQFSVFFQLTI